MTSVEAHAGFRPGTAVLRTVTRPVLSNGWWVWGIAVVATVAIPLVVDRFGGQPLSVFATAIQGPRWYLFVLVLIIVAAGFGPSVALGLTRREFVRQIGTAGVVAGAAYGVVAGLVQTAEHAFHAAQGWGHESVFGMRPMPAGPWLLVTVDHMVALCTFALAGLAVGATYYRWGGWLGTLALPLTVGPVLTVPGLLAHVEPVELGNGLDALPYPAGLALSLALAAALWGIAFIALRGASVRPTSQD